MVTAVSFNRDGTQLASASLDKTVQLWEVTTAHRDLTGLEPLSPALIHPQPVHDAVFSPDGKRLVAVGESGMVIVWDVATRTQLYRLRGHREVVERVAFSRDGRWLATAGWDKTIRIWDMASDPASGQAASPVDILTGHTDPITGICFSADGKRLASSSGDQTIRIWDTASGNEALTLHRHPDSVYGVAFSPDGRLLISASSRDIKVWDAGTGQALPDRAK